MPITFAGIGSFNDFPNISEIEYIEKIIVNCFINAKIYAPS